MAIEEWASTYTRWRRPRVELPILWQESTSGIAIVRRPVPRSRVLSMRCPCTADYQGLYALRLPACTVRVSIDRTSEEAAEVKVKAHFRGLPRSDVAWKCELRVSGSGGTPVTSPLQLKVVRPLERELKACWSKVLKKRLLEYFLTVSSSSGTPVTSAELKVVRPLGRRLARRKARWSKFSR